MTSTPFVDELTVTPATSREHDADGPGGSGTVPGTTDTRRGSSDTEQVLVLFVAAAGALSVALGVLVLRRRPRLSIGWLLIAHGVSLVLVFSVMGGRSGRVGDQLGSGAWVFLFLWLVLIAYLLPDGRAASATQRMWIRGGLLGVVLFVVGAAGDRAGYRSAHHGAAPPVAWLSESVSGILGVIGLVAVVLLVLGSIFAVRRRLKRSTGEDRERLLWLVWGALTVPLTLVVGWANHFLLGNDHVLIDAALAFSAIALPSVIALSIVRHRLFDIQVVLSRTLTYATLLIGILALDALLLYTAESITGANTAGGVLAVCVVAVSVHPVYSRLRRRIEHWVYGYRSEPDQALRLLANRVESADADALSFSIAEAVADALRVDRVWLERLDDSPDLDLDSVVRVPLVHRDSGVGALAIDVPAGRTLSAADRALLHDLARHAAVLVRAEQLNADLSESRSRIVIGREEERRRLRRDLHDGLGPSLAAIVLKLNAAQKRRGQQQDELIGEARDEVKSAIAEVRRLVDDLRPPAIDEVGLVAAIAQRASSLSHEINFEVVGPDLLPPLPAAVEVAAFRIASEAMTNVVKHSAARRCRILIAVDDSFELIIEDNGHGADQTAPGGVGWTSIRERAAEVGGRCTISSRPEGGLVVRAVLPVEDLLAHHGVDAHP